MDLAAELNRYGPDAPPRAVAIEDARDYCRKLAERHYENFTVVSRLFPEQLHQHLCNVYAYCRWVDDLADEVQTTAPPLVLLDWWERQLDALYAGEALHPVFVALGETVRQFALDRRPFADLLSAFRRDQAQFRYATLAELLTYCNYSANPVGRIVLALGRSFNDENSRLSDYICTGLQLANFCQDVRRDWERGRIYLPQDLARKHGWTDDRFAAGKCDDDFRALLRTLVFDTETMLMEGEPLTARVHRDLQPSLRVFVAGGFAILAAIRRCRYDVWSRRPTVGPLTKLRLVATAWWRG